MNAPSSVAVSSDVQALRDRCAVLAADVKLLEEHGGSFEACTVLAQEIARLNRERLMVEEMERVL